MKKIFLSLALFSCSTLLGASPATAPGSGERVFAFHPDRGTAEIFDADTLERLAEGPAPEGAFAALAALNASGAAKYYLVGERAVRVWGDGYRSTALIALAETAEPRSEAVALASGGRILLVASARGVHRIDAEADRLIDHVEAGFDVAGLLPTDDPDRFIVVARDAAAGRAFDAASGRFDDDVTVLPETLSAWSASPDQAQVFAAAGAGFHELTAGRLSKSSAPRERLLGTVFPKARVEEVGRLEVTDSGRFFYEAGGRLFSGNVGVAGGREIPSPNAGRASAWTVNLDGSRLYRVENGRLRGLDGNGSELVREADLAGVVSGLDFVSPKRQAAGSLQALGDGTPTVAGGTYFSLRVRAVDETGAPEADLPVFASNVTPDPPGAECFPAVTDAAGEAEVPCRLGETDAATTLRVTISDAAGRGAPVFRINAVPALEFSGVTVIDGADRRVPESENFTITVLAARERLPAPGLTLTVSESPINALNCPNTVLTGADGTALITCAAGDVALATPVEVAVSDDQGATAVAELIIDPAVGISNGIDKVSGDNQTIGQFQRLPAPLVVRNTRDGQPRADALMNVLFGPNDATFIDCPLQVRTNAEGIASFFCTARSIQFFENRMVVIRLSDDTGRLLQDPFTVTITRSAVGGAGLSRVSDREITLPIGRAVPNALRVAAVAAGGVPRSGAEVFFSSDDDVILDPPTAVTDASGIASVTVTMGCNPGNRAAVTVGLRPDQPLLDFVIDADPGRLSQLIKVRGDNQSGGPGQTLSQDALVAVTADTCGNVLSRERVVWRVLPAFAATLRNVVSESDAQGRVSALATLGAYGGPFQVEVGNADASTRFDLAVNLPGTQFRARSGDGQTAAPGAEVEQPLVVQVLAASGFGVSATPVQFRVVEGSGQLSTTSATTDGAGLAFTRLQVGSGAGAQPGVGPRVRVEAEALGQTVSFTINELGVAGPSAPREGFVNAASFRPGLVPGGIVSIFGTGLADDAAAASQAPLPTRLNGVEVRVGGVPAPLFFVSEGQLNAQVPFETAPGATTVVLDNNGRTAEVANLAVLRASPGVFVLDLEGRGVAAALHEDSTLITPSDPARPGEVVQLFYTGGGPVSPPVPTNQPGPISPVSFTTLPATVAVDDAPQEGFGAAYAPGFIGLYQVNFRLSSDASPGDRAVSVIVDGAVSAEATLPTSGSAALR